MTVKATLELAETTLVWPQTTLAASTLSNEGDLPLEYVNKDNDKAHPTLIVTAVETGHVERFERPPPPGGPFPEVTVAPGGARAEKFLLASRVRFPGPGIYSLRAHHTWNGGSVASVPVRVELLPAAPRALRLETTSGGPAGHVHCAWVSAEGDKGALWLSLVTAVAGSEFALTTRLADVPVEAQPVLSLPPLSASSRQYVAWLDGPSIGFVAHAPGKITRGSVRLDEPASLLVPPLLESPFDPALPPRAEALVVSELAQGFALRAIVLGEAAEASPRTVHAGPVPRWAHTAYRADASRVTTFLAPRWLRPGEPGVSVLVAPWGPLLPPETLPVVAEWPGTVLAADQRLAADGTAVGAVVIDMTRDPAKPRYALQRFRVTPENAFEEGTLTWVAWDRQDPIATAVLRVSGHGEPFALLMGRDGGGFSSCDARGHVTRLEGAAGSIGAPLDVFFVDWTEPAILYTEPRAGLRVLSTTHTRPVFSPAGAAV